MNSRLIPRRTAPCLALALVLGAGAAAAAVRVDVTAGFSMNEDTRIFLNVTNQVWHPMAPATLMRRCRLPENEFPVVAFLAYHSRKDPDAILRLRSDGYPWYEIIHRLRVDPAVLFVGIDRDPGPPYGKAWGRWWKYRRAGAHQRIHFSDGDVVGLVKVQTASRHFGASAFSIIEVRNRGKRVEVYTASRWREKHGRQTWSEDRDEGRGHRDDGDRDDRHDDSREKGAKSHKGKSHNHEDDRDR